MRNPNHPGFDERDYRLRAVAEIRQLLKDTGWSPARLAREAGVAPSTITRALDEATTFAPSAKTMEKVRAACLDLSIAVAAEQEVREHDSVALAAAGMRQATGAVPVVGTINMDAWYTAVPPVIDFLSIDQPEYGDRTIIAYQISGSKSDHELQDGTYVITLDYREATFAPGDVIVVRRWKEDLWSLSLMDLTVEDGVPYVSDRDVVSHNILMEAKMEYLPRFTLRSELERRAEILGVVIATYRKMPRVVTNPIDIPTQDDFQQLHDLWEPGVRKRK